MQPRFSRLLLPNRLHEEVSYGFSFWWSFFFSCRRFIPRSFVALKPALVKTCRPCENPLPGSVLIDQLSVPQCFKSMYVGTTRYSSFADENKRRDDSCVFYTHNNQQRVGRILAIVKEKDQQPQCIVQPVVVSKKITFTVNRKKYECPNLFYGYFRANDLLLINWRDLHEKLAYVRYDDELFIFFRFPNLVESS